jgi:hypothetical protein
LGDHKYDISHVPRADEIENLIVLHPYSKSTIMAKKQLSVEALSERAFGARKGHGGAPQKGPRTDDR